LANVVETGFPTGRPHFGMNFEDLDCQLSLNKQMPVIQLGSHSALDVRS